jgi:hypothetical protein
MPHFTITSPKGHCRMAIDRKTGEPARDLETATADGQLMAELFYTTVTVLDERLNVVATPYGGLPKVG